MLCLAPCARASSSVRTQPLRCLSSTPQVRAGTFKVENGLQIYHERKILPYTQRQLYAVIADTDAYQSFVPFVTSSKVVRHEGPGNLEQKPWLDLQNGTGDSHKLQHEMRIGVLGFDEAWTSNVECNKFHSVSASSNRSKLFKTLSTTWTLMPAPNNAPHPSNSLPQNAAALSNPGQSSDSAVPTEDSADGPTMVNIDLAWQFANPLYAAAAGTAFQRVSGKIMEAFEKRVREVHGPGMK